MNVICAHVDCIQMPAPNFASLMRRSFDTTTLGRVENNDFRFRSLRICPEPFLFRRKTGRVELIAKTINRTTLVAVQPRSVKNET